MEKVHYSKCGRVETLGEGVLILVISYTTQVTFAAIYMVAESLATKLLQLP